MRGASWLVAVLLAVAAAAPAPAAAAALPGQIVVHPETRSWLAYERDLDGDGRKDPLYVCGPGDPENFLYRGTRNPDGTRDGDQDQLIDKLEGTGANSIYLQVIRSHGGDGPFDHNPFVNSDPLQGLDDDILDQWESWFHRMDELGIVIHFTFYDDSAVVWWTGEEVGSEEAVFFHALVNRFQHHRHLIWSVAEEYDEAYTPPRISALAQVIRAADDHAHPIAVHALHGVDFSEFADDPFVDQFSMQVDLGDEVWVQQQVELGWELAEGRYNLNMLEHGGHGTGQVMRRKNWAAAMGGAYVMVLGMDIASTPLDDLEACGHQRAFFEATDFDRMAPHGELAWAGTDHVLARPGASYIAYAAALEGEMGLRDLPQGVWALNWLDVAAGTVVEEIRLVPGGDHAWSPPAAIGPEVALWARRLPPPDSPPPAAVFPDSAAPPAGRLRSIAPLPPAD